MTPSLAAQKKSVEPFEVGRDAFETLFECVSEAIVLSDETGCIIRVNTPAEKLFGYSRDELRGQPIEMLVPERFRQAHLGHRWRYQQDPRRRAMNTGLKLRGRHRDGREFLIDVMLCPLEQGPGNVVLSLIHDLSQCDTGERLKFHLATLVNSSGDAIIGTTLDGVIADWNHNAQRIFGYRAEEVIGKPISLLLPTGGEDEESDILERLTRGETIPAYEVVRRRKDAREVYVSVTILPIFDHMGNLLGTSQVTRDITERIRAEEALHVSGVRYRRLFETAQDGILILEFATSQVLDMNQFLIDLLGYSHAELVGKKLWEIGPVKDISASRSAFADLQTKGDARYENLPLETKDGRRIEVEFVSNVYESNGERVIKCNIRNITERKLMESELQLSRAQAISSARLSALGMMAGGIAHEINNPLAIIYASASNLLEMAESGTVSLNELQDTSARIKHTANRISKIVLSLRQIARDGSADPLQQASAGEIVEHALELCKERFREHSVRLDTSLVDSRLHVSCREVQIAQVLLNLLQNAYDAVVECQGDRWVRLEVGSHEQSVIFAVIDSGPGVPPELRTRIMEPFFTTKPVGKGTGLGLSLSKAIIEDHGGELTLCEREHHTCFSFSLPLSKEPENAATECVSSRCG